MQVTLSSREVADEITYVIPLYNIIIVMSYEYYAAVQLFVLFIYLSY